MRREGPAFAMLPRLAGRKLCVSIVTVAEFLEGARDRDEAARALARFTVQPLAWAQARRCAVIQARAERRLGENDAWLVATAEILGAEVVARDRGAFARLGERYLRF